MKKPNLQVPKRLYHRTTVENYVQIVLNGRIKSSGTKASYIRFHDAKFDKNGNDTWKCVFLADNIKMTKELTWGGDIVLEISTENLNNDKFAYDGNANPDCYRHSFKYFDDIAVDAIVKVISDKWNNRKVNHE